MKSQTYAPARPESVSDRDTAIRDSELVLLRSNLLSRNDRALLQMVYDRGGTFEQIARLTGQSASTVNRRFHRVLKKLMARELTALLHETKGATPLEISIARAYFVQGLSQQDITEKLGLTAYRVRITLRAIRQIIYRSTVRKATQ